MTCAICGAAIDRARTHCVICGHARSPEEDRRWDRAAEAALYEDLQAALEPEENLLGATRGRAMGNWPARPGLNPQAMLSPFANVGLTGERLIVQHVHPGTGRAVGKAGSIPLKDVHAMSVSDVDALEPGRTLRLVVTLASGMTSRLRAFGRMAESARELQQVWRTLADGPRVQPVVEYLCAHCRRSLDRPYRFCPFCGRPLEDQ